MTDEQNGPEQTGRQVQIAERVNREELGTMRGNASSAGAFLVPENMGLALEFSKVMATAVVSIPQHLRGKPSDCLAVAMQAWRWRMDPFACASKSFFVNGRLAYEAQLIVAAVNMNAPLDGRLKVEWTGEGEALVCTVSGKFKGDSRTFTVYQDIKSIKTRNSPLWVSSPRQQLGYYTQRLWARLHCPEVILGAYAREEVETDAEEQPDGTYIARPTRTQVTQQTNEVTGSTDYELVMQDGEVFNTTDPEKFCNAFVQTMQLAAEHGAQAVEDVWNIGSRQLGDVRAGTLGGGELAQRCHDEHDAILKAFDEKKAAGNGTPAFKWLVAGGKELSFATAEEWEQTIIGQLAKIANSLAIKKARERNGAVMAGLATAGYSDAVMRVQEAFDARLGAAL